MGISVVEYGRIAGLHHPELSAFTATGSALSVASGRLSFTYGAQGPSMSVDTACSSSLVCVHLAVKAISVNECPDAAVCGINLTQDVVTQVRLGYRLPNPLVCEPTLICRLRHQPGPRPRDTGEARGPASLTDRRYAPLDVLGLTVVLWRPKAKFFSWWGPKPSSD